MARFLLICALLLTGMSVYAQTTLSGKVTDAKTGEALFAANVVLLKNGTIVTGAETDFDGNFSMAGLDPGTYDIRCTYTAMSEKLTTGYPVKAGKSNILDIQMESSVLNTVIISGYRNPPIDLDNTTVNKALTGKEVAAMPTKNLESVASAAAGVGQADEGRGITVRGSRDDGNLYMVDGVRVGAGSLPPAQDVEQLEIITGGLPAAMGDASGGIISVTTKSGASKFTGGAELETSQYLDAFGYNLVGVNLAGPIVKNKDKEAIVSFRLSGQYRTRLDDGPYANGFTKAKDGVIADLKENPATLIGVTNIIASDKLVRIPIVNSRARELTADKLENVKANPNARDTRYDINGKVDFKLSKQMDFVLGGNYWNEAAKEVDNDRNLLNFDRNGNRATNNLRVWGRLRHRLDAEKKEKNAVNSIENVFYTLQGGYTVQNDKYNDAVHGDNLFNYGYIGNFDIRYDYGTQSDAAGNITQKPYTATLYNYTPNQNFMGNSTLINANKIYSDFFIPGEANGLTMENFAAYNGFVSDNFKFTYFDPASAQGVHSMGIGYNSVQKRQRNTAEVRIDGSFDFLPTRNRNNVHSIQMGLLYEQRDEHRWSMAPRGLYQLASQLVNKQLTGGFDNTIRTSVLVGGTSFNILDPSYIAENHTNFDKKLRESLGMAEQSRDFINVNGLSPDQLKLSMFSADELGANRASGLSYYGYDYLGNPLSGNVKFDDFFTAKDANGNFTRPIAAFTPNYAVGYIQDKFKLEDIIFRVGLRVDRYDASTKTLIDPFNLYDGHTYRAEEYAQEKKYQRPANIGENFIVYADPNASYNADNPDGAVKAYRNGEQWYTREGTAVNDPSLIFGNTGKATPAFRSTFTSESRIQGKDFEVNKTFSTYSPQIIVSPRLSFSFPISKTAGFFAHYDVLVQRPPSNNISNPLDYYYFENRTPDPNTRLPNSNLKPQRTIDYEVGFQQMVSKTAAIKLQAYYKEMRDMIQERVFAKAYPNRYTSYSNIDFGTVKGLTFTFDQRTINNLQFNMAYTLQFADGTGSSSTSSRGITLPEGRINRSIFPLSYDERHKIVLSADYHYPTGKSYEGPVVFGYKIFEDAGINLLTSFTSGRPFTQEEVPGEWSGSVKIGSIAGSRLPWNNVVNLRLDKNFTLSKNPKSPLSLNVYFRVQNLLDTRNVLNVYSVTGSPYNDGYLATNRGNGQAEASGNPAAYTLVYNTIMLNPDYFSLPRRMFLGAQFFF
jgi:outer membrane receptor protein involved in Fe transport